LMLVMIMTGHQLVLLSLAVMEAHLQVLPVIVLS
jgi:hypothetical protein